MQMHILMKSIHKSIIGGEIALQKMCASEEMDNKMLVNVHEDLKNKLQTHEGNQFNGKLGNPEIVRFADPYLPPHNINSEESVSALNSWEAQTQRHSSCSGIRHFFIFIPLPFKRIEQKFPRNGRE